MIQSIRGMNDILPDQIPLWLRLEGAGRETLAAHGFSEIRLPIVESSELFSRSLGAGTDIVEKEMYSFEDREGRKLTLRPEGTASVVRAYLEHHLGAQQPIVKLFYLGPMFRYERPQAGRFRQFYQIGAEVLGNGQPAVDVELMSAMMQIFGRLSLPGLELQINSLGCPACRPQYRAALVNYLKPKLDQLCPTCRRRFQTNPMRVLDCKEPGCQTVIAGAPSTLDFLCQICLMHFLKVKEGLNRLKIPFTVNQRLVRGLDYYTRTAFEVLAPGLGAQNAIAAGGRYDGLVELLGGPPTPASGFAIGMERVAALLSKEVVAEETAAPGPDLFVAVLGEKPRGMGAQLVQELREAGVRVEAEAEPGSLKSQMRRADRLGSRFVLILGEEELKTGRAILRNMAERSQETMPLEGLAQQLREKFVKEVAR